MKYSVCLGCGSGYYLEENLYCKKCFPNYGMPKDERKYKSIEEFFEKSEWIFDEYINHGTHMELYIEYSDGKTDIAGSLFFPGVNKEECDKKLLDWANNEYR